MRRPNVSGNVDTIEVTPYSEYYGWLPRCKVATANGIGGAIGKGVSSSTCHFTGKTPQVVEARRTRLQQEKAQGQTNVFRRQMIEIANAQLRGKRSLSKDDFVEDDSLIVGSFIAARKCARL